MRKVALLAGLLMAVGAAGTVQAQAQPRSGDLVRPFPFMAAGPGSQIGISIRDLESDEADKLKLPGDAGAVVEACSAEARPRLRVFAKAMWLWNLMEVSRTELPFDVDRLRDSVDRFWPMGRGALGVVTQEMTPELAAYFGVRDKKEVSLKLMLDDRTSDRRFRQRPFRGI